MSMFHGCRRRNEATEDTAIVYWKRDWSQVIQDAFGPILAVDAVADALPADIRESYKRGGANMEVPARLSRGPYKQSRP